MKVNCGDKCFLCLTNLELSSSSSCGGGRQKQKEINGKPNLHLSVLIKYLLGTWDENDSLLQRIRRLQLREPSSSSSDGRIKFCDKCQDSASRISHLHMELDVIQMKIVDILCSLRKTVFGNFNGSDGTSRLSLEEFAGETQAILDTLHEFQAAVVEKSKESVHVPLVYIEKFTGCNLKTNRANPTSAEEDKLNPIKTEPEADPMDEILSDFEDDYDYAATPIVEFNEQKVEDVDPQEETMDTNDDVWRPPGHGRSAAPLASSSPPPPRKLQKPSIKSKKTKIKQAKRKRGRPRKNLAEVESKKGAPAQILPRKRIHFQCELCSYKTRADISFRFEHHLRQHEYPEVVNHICPHCTNPVRQFSQQQSFDYHMNSHAGQNKMMCDICTKLIDPFAILKHLRGHPEVGKIFQCSCCSYCCGTREGYLKHTRHHRTAALICDVCSQKFRTRQRLLDHMHNEHQLLEKIRCDVGNCGLEFFETSLLLVHKKRHLETETFPCLECSLQFPSTRHLLGHQVQEHSREKPHRCSECPEAFMDKVTLQKHLINAHGAAKLKCPYCPKEFASQVILSSHINLHEGISFPCDKCDKVFGNRGKLRSHQYVHKTTKDFICEECGKAFRSAKLLKIHLKIHIGDRKHKYKCSYCSKGFVERQNLTVHERIHTGEKPYVCEACGKDFNQRSGLNLHKRSQHKELIAIKNKSEVTSTESTSTVIPQDVVEPGTGPVPIAVERGKVI